MQYNEESEITKDGIKQLNAQVEQLQSIIEKNISVFDKKLSSQLKQIETKINKKLISPDTIKSLKSVADIVYEKEKDPVKKASYYFKLGRTLFGQKESSIDDIISTFSKCIELSTDEDTVGNAYTYLGICYGEKKDYAQAEVSFLNALHFGPNKKEKYFLANLGYFYLNNLKLSKSREYFSKALDIDIDYAYVLKADSESIVFKTMNIDHDTGKIINVSRISVNATRDVVETATGEVVSFVIPFDRITNIYYESRNYLPDMDNVIIDLNLPRGYGRFYRSEMQQGDSIVLSEASYNPEVNMWSFKWTQEQTEGYYVYDSEKITVMRLNSLKRLEQYEPSRIVEVIEDNYESVLSLLKIKYYNSINALNNGTIMIEENYPEAYKLPDKAKNIFFEAYKLKYVFTVFNGYPAKEMEQHLLKGEMTIAELAKFGEKLEKNQHILHKLYKYSSYADNAEEQKYVAVVYLLSLGKFQSMQEAIELAENYGLNELKEMIEKYSGETVE